MLNIKGLEEREYWIIAANFTPEAKEVIETNHVTPISFRMLVNDLPKSERKLSWQKYILFESSLVDYPIKQNLYSELRTLLNQVYKASSQAAKGKSLERLAESFLGLFSGLRVINKNVRIESEELDLVVRNEAEKIFWQRLGTPIIVECKNWSSPVGASEVRDLVLKMREVRTAFLIARHGVTSGNGANYEILEARKKGKYIICLNLADIEDILIGINPQAIVEERFYSLWTKL
jgi:hypothetical protein